MPLNKNLLLVALVFAFFGASLSAAEVQIYFKATPPVNNLRPFADPANLSLLVTAADGKPIAQGRVKILLEAPQPGTFLSTDYPFIEGTRLLDLVLPLRRGRVDWKYLFPIRGEYLLSVEVAAAGLQPVRKLFKIKIREHSTKWLWLGLFSAGLFILGFVAGRIFTSGRKGIAAGIVLLSFAGAQWVGGHEPAAQAKSDEPNVVEVAAATVGKAAHLHWRAGGAEAGPDGGLLSLAITHLEKQKVVFAIERVRVDDEYEFDFHFPDGAEYRLNATAERAGRTPQRSEQLLSVTGIEPPMTAQIPALVLFLAVIALGLAAGRLSKRLA